MSHELEVAKEQAFLDRAYEALEAMREEARLMMEGVLDTGRGGTFQSRTERDIVVRTSLARLGQLEVGDQALTFGRIDVDTGDPEAPEVFHIGRLAVSDEEHEPMIVDWRAPVAEPFYRATGLDPEGLLRRRHLSVSQRTVLGVEDEYFRAADGEVHALDGAGRPEGLADEAMVLGGPGALLAALGAARTGQMGDIVGTIQREQDEIIRAPLTGILMVQGGPGTGKTAVALHRAAYLLYTHRFPLERQGVLVVGPNPLFLRYIEQVLPSLGETGVTLSTISGLVPEVRVTGRDPEAVERLKGDPRMVKVMARAVKTRQRALRQDVPIIFGATTLTLSTTASAEIISRARRRPGTHNARRRFVENEVATVLATQSQARRGLDLSDEEFDFAEFTRQIRRSPELTEALHRMWPRLSPHELLHDLLGAPALMRAAGDGVLNPEEIERMVRERSATLEDVLWTAADAALIDELRTLLGPRRSTKEKRRAAPKEDGWPLGLDGGEPERRDRTEVEVLNFGHIVVDEVQDLSPMQLRMLARRSLSGSMTVVGDIAQATGPWAPDSWAEVAHHLGARREPHLVELTVSYRTPAEVIELSARVLAASGTGLEPPRPVRRAGVTPRIDQVPAHELARAVARAAAEESAACSPGHVAVLAPRSLLTSLAQGFVDEGVDFVDPRAVGGPGLGAPLVLLAVDEANGLEFDGVVVVEPAEVAERGAEPGEQPAAPTRRGLRTLYVAMTRPTTRLRLVGSREAPVGLKG